MRHFFQKTYHLQNITTSWGPSLQIPKLWEHFSSDHPAVCSVRFLCCDNTGGRKQLLEEQVYFILHFQVTIHDSVKPEQEQDPNLF